MSLERIGYYRIMTAICTDSFFQHNFFWTEAEKEQVYYFKGDKSETKKPLSDFVSN